MSMEKKTALCQGCDTRKATGRIFSIRVQKIYDVCKQCRPSFIKANIQESGEKIYKTLKLAVENADHNQSCDRFGLGEGVGYVCSCWYGKARKSLDAVEGKVT